MIIPIKLFRQSVRVGEIRAITNRNEFRGSLFILSEWRKIAMSKIFIKPALPIFNKDRQAILFLHMGALWLSFCLGGSINNASG